VRGRMTSDNKRRAMKTTYLMRAAMFHVSTVLGSWHAVTF